MKLNLSNLALMRYLGIMAVAIFIFSACTNDQADEPNAVECNLSDVSFKTDVMPIIERSCSYQSSCHAAGASNGDFISYETLQEDLDNGKFANRVLVGKDMPPQYAPEDRPKSLDASEIVIIQCWADGGYQNN